jgi:hypothetical protein
MDREGDSAMSSVSTREALSIILPKLEQAHHLIQTPSPAPDILVQAEMLLEDALAEMRKMMGITRWPAPTTEQPSLETIEEWMWEDGGCEATDGCCIEVDVAPWYGVVN